MQYTFQHSQYNIIAAAPLREASGCAADTQNVKNQTAATDGWNLSPRQMSAGRSQVALTRRKEIVRCLPHFEAMLDVLIDAFESLLGVSADGRFTHELFGLFVKAFEDLLRSLCIGYDLFGDS